MSMITEDIFLFLLDERSGTLLAPVPERTIHLAFAGAMLMDLQLARRIDTDLDTLTLIDPTPFDDALLDPVLGEIVAADDRRDAAHWIEIVSKKGAWIYETVIGRLVDRNILERPEADGDVFLTAQAARARRYSGVDGVVHEEVKLRVMRSLFEDSVPDPSDAALIGLANACNVFERTMPASEYDSVKERIELYGGIDPIIHAVADAVRVVGAATQAEARALSDAIPVVSGRFLSGSAYDLLGDMNGYLARQYQRYGPIFRIKMFGRALTVLAGPEANDFMMRRERFHLHTGRTVSRSFHDGLGDDSILMMNGSDHARMRREMRHRFSRAFMEEHLPEAVDIARDQIRRWPLNERMPANIAMRKLFIEQVSRITANASALEYFDDIRNLFRILTIRYSIPGLWILRARKFRRIRQRVDELLGSLLSEHQTRRRNRHADLIDDLIEVHRNDPVFMTETLLRSNALAPFIVAVDTVGTMGTLMLYFLLKHPDVLQRVRAEADALLADGPPTAADLRGLDVTHRVAMETMRMCPLAPALLRRVVTSFDFAGYRIPADQEILIAAGITHLLPEYFPNPERFDIDRFLPGRDEHRQPGIYVPFGLGLHRCLGTGFAENQLALTLLTLLHETDLEMDPPDYKLKLVAIPATSANDKFAIKVRGFRQAGRENQPMAED